MAKLNKPLWYALAAAALGFVVVRQVMAARGTPTIYNGNTYSNEAAAAAERDTDLAFTTPTNATPGLTSSFVVPANSTGKASKSTPDGWVSSLGTTGRDGLRVY